MKKYKSFFKSIVIVMGTQALVYFLIKNILHNYNIMETILYVPFIKSFVYFYDSWYPVILITAFIIFNKDKDTYYKLVFSLIISAFLAHISFIIYPTMILRPSIEVKTFTDWVLDFTYKSDMPAVNCLPSVHCLYCFVSIFYIIICKNLKIHYKVFIIIYHILIVLSTVFIKQHIIEDTMLSLIYTILVITIVYRFKDDIYNLLKFIF